MRFGSLLATTIALSCAAAQSIKFPACAVGYCLYRKTHSSRADKQLRKNVSEQHSRIKTSAAPQIQHVYVRPSHSTKQSQHACTKNAASKRAYVCNNHPAISRNRLSNVLTLSTAAANATSVMCNAPVRSRSNTIMLFTSLSASLAFIATCVRISVALFQGSFGLDDASAIIAELTNIPFTVFVAYLSSIGFGRDTWTVDPEKLYTFQKVSCYHLPGNRC